jgi:HD-GYP domain-containing protein (c-di-GMP phosphodiesterase class II)
MAERAGLDHAVVERLCTGAALHDVGKIDIPDEILQKPGKLTGEEYEVIKTHTTLGHERLVRMGETDPIILNLVRHHHERIDGKGYPDGLAGDAIPIGARYFAVIDSFDAMTSVRPYRQEVGDAAAEKALAELHAGIGTRYEGQAVELMTSLYRAGELDYILRHFNDRCELPALENAASAHTTPHAARAQPARAAR